VHIGQELLDVVSFSATLGERRAAKQSVAARTVLTRQVPTMLVPRPRGHHVMLLGTTMVGGVVGVVVAHARRGAGLRSAAYKTSPCWEQAAARPVLSARAPRSNCG